LTSALSSVSVPAASAVNGSTAAIEKMIVRMEFPPDWTG
jgi:hypothetical protein